MYSNGNTRPQSAPMGRNINSKAATNGLNITVVPSLNLGGNSQQQQSPSTSSLTANNSNNAAVRPIGGRPSSAIAHLRLATALQQSSSSSSLTANNNNTFDTNNNNNSNSSTNNNNNQQQQQQGPSKLLRPQSAAIAGRYLPQSVVAAVTNTNTTTGNMPPPLSRPMSATINNNNNANSRSSSPITMLFNNNGIGGNRSHSSRGNNSYEGLVAEADSSLNHFNSNNNNDVEGGHQNNNSVSTQDAAIIASLKGEIMLLQRVLETVEEFDLAFPPYPSLNNTPRGGVVSGGAAVANSHNISNTAVGYQPVTFSNNNKTMSTSNSGGAGNYGLPSHYHSNTTNIYNNNNTTTFPSPSIELQAIEQQLIAIQPSMLSDKSISDAKIALLELLVERLKAVSVAALRKCDVNAAELRVMPSRVSGFTTLIKFVMEIAERKRAWENRLRMISNNSNNNNEGNDMSDVRSFVPSPPPQTGGGGDTTAAVSSSSAAAAQVFAASNIKSFKKNKAFNIADSNAVDDLIMTQHTPRKNSGNGQHAELKTAASASAHPVTLMDLALNEPTVSEIQNLIAEQKQLQASLKKLLSSQQQQASSSSSPTNAAGSNKANRASGVANSNNTTNSGAAAVGESRKGSIISNDFALHEIDKDTLSNASTATPTTSAAKKKGSSSASVVAKRGSVVAAGSRSGSGGRSGNNNGAANNNNNAMLLDPIRVQHMEAHLKQKTADLALTIEKCEDLKHELAAMKKAKEEVEKELTVMKATEIAQRLEYESEWNIRGKVAGIAFGPNPNTNNNGVALLGAPPPPSSPLNGSSSMSAGNNNNNGFTSLKDASSVSGGQNNSASTAAFSPSRFAGDRSGSVSFSSTVAAAPTSTSNNNNFARNLMFSNSNLSSGSASIPDRLLRFGIPQEMLVAPYISETEGAVFLSKLQEFFAEATQFVAENNSTMKGRKAIRALQDEIAAQQAKQQAAVNGSAAEKAQMTAIIKNGGVLPSSPTAFSSGGADKNGKGNRNGGNNNISSRTGGANNASGGANGTASASALAGSLSAGLISSASTEWSNNNPATAATLAAMGILNPSSLIALLPRSEALDGVGWLTLHRQNEIIKRLCDLLDEQAKTHESSGNESQTEIDRLQRMVKTLEERIAAFKVENAKIKQNYEQLQYEYEERNRPGGASDGKFTTAADKKRIVQTKNQPMTAAEREKDLHKTILAKDKKIEHITDQLKLTKYEVDEKATEIASMSRERISLLSKCSEESLKVQALQKQLEEAYQIKQSTQDNAMTMKRELREKTVLEADNAQKLWKSQVELHIAHNVIAELRKREQQLLDDLDDAVEQRRILREQLETKAMENRKLQTVFELQLQEARAAVDAAKASLYQERQQMLANEKEMERLRVVDVQLETMEQNFNNYAVSMIVKREAGEEEERVLGDCLAQIQEDVFALPEEETMGEEQLTLMLAKLVHKKEILDNETRINKQAEVALGERKRLLQAQTAVIPVGGSQTNNASSAAGMNLREGPTAEEKEQAAIISAEQKLTNKKKLGLLLQRRYTDIQIYACERRLAEVRRGMQLRETMTELNSIQQVHEAMLKELSQTRSQLDAMAQRNSELEVERRQLIKDREREETNNKKLMSQVQRLNVTSEVQENMLIDLGTKLQNEKIASSSPPRGAANQQQFNRTNNNNPNNRQQLNASQSSQMTIMSQTGNGGLAVSGEFGDDVAGAVQGGAAAARGGGGLFGGNFNGSNMSSASTPAASAGAQKQIGKKQYNIAPLGPVL